jgi:catechol 2,3-dioxygenase-like lactoylglutathione lyase family enzyme
MIKVRRIGHATFETPDLDRMIDYHTQVTGMILVARETDRVFLAARTGQLAIELKKAPQARCARLAFEVGADEDFADMAKRLTGLGVRSDMQSDAAPGTPRALVFNDPKGTEIALFKEWQSAGRNAVGQGVGVLKLGHLAFCVDEPAPIADFYARVLGFKVSDWIGDMFVFMRCNADHHTVNFIKGPHGRMHHIAFELRDAAHLHVACDVLGEKDINIVWGPVRLGPGHNVATFHRNPDDQVVELFAELDLMKDEALGYYDPRPWHKDHPQRPKVWPESHGTQYIWGLPPSPEFIRARK